MVAVDDGYVRLGGSDSEFSKAVLALLVGTLAFSFSLLRRVGTNFVPNLGTTIAGLLLVVSLLVFLIFLDRFLHRADDPRESDLLRG